jgi:hypothetical protein
MGGVGVRDGELGAEVYAVINLLMRTARDRSPIGALVEFGAGPLAARALPEADWLGGLPPAVHAKGSSFGLGPDARRRRALASSRVPAVAWDWARSTHCRLS